MTLPVFLLPLVFLGLCASFPESTLEPGSPLPGPTPPIIPGDTSVSHNGYVTVDKKNGAKMFYWLFTPPNAGPDTDLIVWLQGGPGCSSLLGLTMENGPIKATPQGFKLNPYAWTSKYRILYLDNPVGSGFSYVTEEDGYLNDEPSVAGELYTTISTVIASYGLHTAPVWLMGESYAGKYVPVVAHRIHTENGKVPAAQQINLKGMAIGNGMSDPVTQATTYADFAYNLALVDEQKKRSVAKMQTKIVELIKSADWQGAWTEWDNLVDGTLAFAGKPSSYDIRTYTKLDTRTPATLLGLNSTVSKLNVGGRQFKACNHQVYTHLKADMMKSVIDLFPVLIDNYKVLIYHGQFDFVVNTPGVNKFLAAIQWPEIKDFISSERKIWKVKGTPAGLVRNHKNLSQVIILGAGHMTPMDQPLHTFRMVQRFISGQGFDA